MSLLVAALIVLWLLLLAPAVLLPLFGETPDERPGTGGARSVARSAARRQPPLGDHGRAA